MHSSVLIVRELSLICSNWGATQSLDDWLVEHRIPVLDGVDTRSLVKTIRSSGECSGLLAPSDSRHTLDSLREESLALPSMGARIWPEKFRPGNHIVGRLRQW